MWTQPLHSGYTGVLYLHQRINPWCIHNCMALGRGWRKQEGALAGAVSTRHAFGWWPSSLSLCLLSAVKFTALLSAFPHYVVLSCHGSRTTGQLTEEQNLWGCESGYALLPFRCLLSYFVSVVKSLAYSRCSRARCLPHGVCTDWFTVWEIS